MIAVLAGAAFAADTWFGGGVTTGVQVVDGAAGTVLSQVELDARAATEDVFFRLDLDYHVDPLRFSGCAVTPTTTTTTTTATTGAAPAGCPAYDFAPHYPLPPEWAMLQLGRKRGFVRLGVTNPNFGLQEWDERDNYLATYSSIWVAQNGQNLGVEPGIRFDDGTEVFVFGGYDLAWFSPGFGAGFWSEQDAWGSWTGAYVLPLLEDAPLALLLSATEWYPLDALWLTLELDAGIAGGGPFGGGQFVANFFPEGIVAAALRADVQVQSDAARDYLGMAPFQATAGVRSDPTDWFHVALDGGVRVPGGGAEPSPLVALLVDLHTPQPEDDYGVPGEEE